MKDPINTYTSFTVVTTAESQQAFRSIVLLSNLYCNITSTRPVILCIISLDGMT